MDDPRTIIVTAPRLWPSAACHELSKYFEKCRLKAYMPTPRDRPTLGWGRTYHLDGTPVKMGETCTQAEADHWYEETVGATSRDLLKHLGNAPCTQHQFDALVCFADNAGPSVYTSTLLKRHLAGDYPGAIAQFSRWVYQDGIKLAGLVRRRRVEAALYALPDDRPFRIKDFDKG
jgi:lysozyme